MYTQPQLTEAGYIGSHFAAVDFLRCLANKDGK